jgi:hypothetical protein
MGNHRSKTAKIWSFIYARHTPPVSHEHCFALLQAIVITSLRPYCESMALGNSAVNGLSL